MTNEELVQIAKDIYNNQATVYAKGGIGWLLTRNKLDSLIRQYPENKKYISEKDLGKHVCDCSGMIVGMAYDGWTVNTNPVWTKAHDWNDQGLHDRLTDTCDPKDAIPGMCLWKQGHVGLYIGDGMAFDSNAEKSGSGIHLRKVTDVAWTLAGKLPEIEYVTVKVGDVIPMTVTQIENGVAYGETRVENPGTIQVGSRVTIDKGAVAGGLSTDPKTGRGVLISSEYANGKYIDVVEKVAKFYGEDEALLTGIRTWVAFKSLNLVE